VGIDFKKSAAIDEMTGITGWFDKETDSSLARILHEGSTGWVI